MRLYDVLLRAYPQTFRDRFGEGMRHALASDLARARSRGRMAAALFWLVTIYQAASLGWQVTVVADRPAETLRRRFPLAHAVVSAKARDAVFVASAASRVHSVTANVPDCVGVPLRRPVAAASETPGGSAPEATLHA